MIQRIELWDIATIRIEEYRGTQFTNTNMCHALPSIVKAKAAPAQLYAGYVTS